MGGRTVRAVLASLALLAITGCSPRLDEPRIGTYRAVLQLPGGEAPFGLEIAMEQERYVLYLSNGGERKRVSDVTVANQELTANFAGETSTLRANLYRNRLEGSVTWVNSDAGQQVIPLRARFGETHRFYKEPVTDNADVAGRWQMTLTTASAASAAASNRAIAMFEQEHDRVTGTVLTADGGHHALEGQVHGDDVQLSTFAGGNAYLYKLRVNDAGGLEGEYWQGLAVHERIAARRDQEQHDEQRDDDAHRTSP